MTTINVAPSPVSPVAPAQPADAAPTVTTPPAAVAPPAAAEPIPATGDTVQAETPAVATPPRADIDNVNLDAEELRALDNLRQTFLADGEMSAAEQKVYQDVRANFAKPTTPSTGAGDAPASLPQAGNAASDSPVDPAGGSGQELSGSGGALDCPPDPVAGQGPDRSSPADSEGVFLVGNLLASPHSVRDYLGILTGQVQGIGGDPSAFGPNAVSPQTVEAARKLLAIAPAEVLDARIPDGKTLALSMDGRIVGSLDTASVTDNQSLGVAGHRKNPVFTSGEGGEIELDGASPSSSTDSDSSSLSDSSSPSGVKHKVIGTQLISPVMLDLNGDGKLGTTGVSTAKQRIDSQVGKTVSFDLDGDGRKENVEWMDGQGDAMLVDDRDGGASRAAAGNGEIDGSRLFGDQGGKFDNGYVKLARHDANGDGKLTGQELEGLKTWVDDGDAKVEAGELKSLAEQGISELSVQMNLQKNARGEDLMRSSFVQNGETKATEDVWFAKAP
ncbi:MAG: hypothetical protein VKP62_05325 [Candidatus Sericytochromatia bacterium]|nr:hypothetical protein [Candidatus Sericytochromatia bacterium]